MTMDIEHLQAWVGRTESRLELIAPTPAAALAATLDRDHAPGLGDPLPPLWHWIYFGPLARQSEMGKDGHPRLGGFMPPVPLPRRMWAGSRMRFLSPVLIGDQVVRETEILKIVQKAGTDGPLVFLTLRHRLATDHGLAIEEEQDVVYRAATSGSTRMSTPTATPPPIGPTALAPAQWRDPMRADPVLLFRYSALTFNGHRIHYDAPYAVREEGYPALVVHGPLTATLLVERLLAHTGGPLAEFDFRGQRPLFVDTDFHLCGIADAGGEYKVWAETPEGATATSARARLHSAA